MTQLILPRPLELNDEPAAEDPLRASSKTAGSSTASESDDTLSDREVGGRPPITPLFISSFWYDFVT